MLALTWSDLDLAASKLTVRRSRTRGRTGTTKSGHGRVVPLAPELAEALAKLGLRGYSDGQDDLIFVGQHGSHMDPPRFRERFYAAQDRARIRPRRAMSKPRS